MKRKPDSKTILRAIVPYPAVFTPNAFGGYDVFFPNFPNGFTQGSKLDLAKNAAREELTYQLYDYLKDEEHPPGPSDPDRLYADEDEAAGTVVFLIEPDREMLLRKLGLYKKKMRTAPSGDKYIP